MQTFTETSISGVEDRRVADVLGIDVELVRDLPPYNTTEEPPPGRLRRGPRGRYLPAAEVDARLAPYTEDARAGVPDIMLANRAGLTLERVRQWRRRHGITGRRGRPPAQLGRTFMVAPLLGEGVSPVPHDVSSPVGGDWRPPVYLLRQPLTYELFAACVITLVDRFTTDEIASAIGIAERDVYHAIVLYGARRGGS